MSQKYILCIGAHPDDNELSVGGTAARFCERGDRVRFVSATLGDKGHFAPEYIADPDTLAARRHDEATAAAAVIGAEYETLGLHDGEVYVHLITTERMVRCIRSFGPPGQGPDLVLFNRPQDYHRDHRYTAQLVLDATYMLTVPMMCPDARHLDRMPVFAYWYDDFSEVTPFRPDVVIPIDNVLDKKIDMTCAHVSQMFEWLPYNAGRLDQVPPESDPAGRREMMARHIRARGEHRRERTQAVLHKQYGANAIRYAEAFQICEYGRVPDAEEWRDLFPLNWTV